MTLDYKVVVARVTEFEDNETNMKSKWIQPLCLSIHLLPFLLRDRPQ